MTELEVQGVTRYCRFRCTTSDWGSSSGLAAFSEGGAAQFVHSESFTDSNAEKNPGGEHICKSGYSLFAVSER